MPVRHGQQIKGMRRNVLSSREKRKQYEPVRNESTREYKRRKNTNFESLYNKPNIKYFLKAKHLKWTDYVRRAEGNIIHKVINKVTGKRPRGWPGQRR